MNKTSGKSKAEGRKPVGNKLVHLPITTKPIIERSVIDGSKFPSQQSKIAQASKTATGTSSVVNVVNSGTSVASRNPASTDAAAASLTPPVNNVIIRRKPLRTASVVACERYIPIISETTGKAISSSSAQKRVDSTNGCIFYSSPQNISHIIHPQLSITPVGSAIAKVLPLTPVTRKLPAQRNKYSCTRCKKPCQANSEKCDDCQNTPALTPSVCQILKNINSSEKTEKVVPPPTKVACITKESFYGNKSPLTQSTMSGNNYRQASSRKVFVTSDHAGNPRGRPKGSKNRVIEPECLTISSDEEDDPDDGDAPETRETVSTPRGSNKLRRASTIVTFHEGHSAASKMKGNHFSHLRPECMKAQLNILNNSKIVENDNGDIIEDEEEIEEEEEDDEDEHMEINIRDSDEPINENRTPGKGTKILKLYCRSIRIGSFKIHPIDDAPFLSVHVRPESFSFQVSRIAKASELVNITLKGPDIAQVLGHFGRCLPIMFIFTTPQCAARIRGRLGMVKGSPMYYDPEVQDEKQKRITFLIDNINDEMRNYLRNTFPGEGILKEIDQKSANEILVKSTPNQLLQLGLIKSQAAAFQPPAAIVTPPTPIQKQPPPQVSVQAVTPIQNVVQTLQSQGTVTLAISVQPISTKGTIVNERPSSPVRKILTYPPAPHVGGITITNVDLSCLDEGEFLNDAIIDFYLKYLVNEKLSEADRNRTHIFSSYFYPRLTQKPTSRSAEDASGSMAFKRHRQVKTWTKNLDLFDKDFIIIPINQNVHWFLAIICYPGLVPNLPETSTTGLPSKSPDSGSPRNDQDSEGPAENSSSLINTISPIKLPVQTREQACDTEDHSSSEGSPQNSCSGFDESEASCMDDSISESSAANAHPSEANRPPPGQKTPCIMIFDSLLGPSRLRIANNLREYLEMEWKMKKGTRKSFGKPAMQPFFPRVPQQTNFSDCGVYVLQYVESFFENPFPYIASPLPDMTNWFTAEKAATKREEIKSLILELEKRGASSTTANTNDNKGNSGRKNSERVSSPNSTNSQISRMATS